MGDVLLVAIMVAFFVLAIGLVRVLGRMIDHDTDPELADEPPDTDDEAAESPGNAAVTTSALPTIPDETRPPKVRTRPAAALFEPGDPPPRRHRRRSSSSTRG